MKKNIIYTLVFFIACMLNYQYIETEKTEVWYMSFLFLLISFICYLNYSFILSFYLKINANKTLIKNLKSTKMLHILQKEIILLNFSFYSIVFLLLFAFLTNYNFIFVLLATVFFLLLLTSFDLRDKFNKIKKHI